MNRQGIRLGLLLAGLGMAAGLTGYFAIQHQAIAQDQRLDQGPDQGPGPGSLPNPMFQNPALMEELIAESSMPTPESAFMDAQRQFGFKLFSEVLRQDEDKNVVLSPASVAIALMMTYNGADGETQQAMAEALALQDLSLEAVNQSSAALMSSLLEADPQVQLRIANALWGNEGVPFESDFLERTSSFYQAEITSLDFGDPETVPHINNWVSEQTEGKIPDIIGSLEPDDLLVLINAIYFKGSWSDEFDPAFTSDRPFTLMDGREISHPQMRRSDEFLYLENEQFQAVRLPYGNGRLGMYVVLPRTRESTASATTEFYASLTAADWKSWLSQFEQRQGLVALPRFTIDYDIQLNAALTTLGMGNAFQPAQANFARLSTQPAYIDAVQHKTYIDVNEEGTEAAAATAVVMAPTSISIPTTPPFEMVVDRPFFFAIQDDQTGAILFMGSILNPEG
jgi:serine protease inhibitor